MGDSVQPGPVSGPVVFLDSFSIPLAKVPMLGVGIDNLGGSIGALVCDEERGGRIGCDVSTNNYWTYQLVDYKRP